MENGSHERENINRAIRFLQSNNALISGGAFLDVGANIGTHTVYAALSGAFSRFLCVEPGPENVQLLRHNLAVNGLAERASVAACAVGRETGKAQMIRNRLNSGNATLAIGRMKVKNASEPFEVPVNRLDRLLREHSIDPAAVGLIWMDVEGFELQALLGATDLLRRSPPIVFEYNRNALTEAERIEMVRVLFQTWSTVRMFDGSEFRSVDAKAFSEIVHECDIMAYGS